MKTVLLAGVIAMTLSYGGNAYALSPCDAVVVDQENILSAAEETSIADRAISLAVGGVTPTAAAACC
jgi:hypothetical protein